MDFANVAAFYDCVLAHPRTREVLAGKSPMGRLEQYFVAASPKDKDKGAVGVAVEVLRENRVALAIGAGLLCVALLRGGKRQ